MDKGLIHPSHPDLSVALSSSGCVELSDLPFLNALNVFRSCESDVPLPRVTSCVPFSVFMESIRMKDDFGCVLRHRSAREVPVIGFRGEKIQTGEGLAAD
ncbi:MAG: hypothetical protein B0D91_14970 [Oceanospirillales bacterium LUC14_002_19_P2]|nr:MAG: hypothetical protein B0D91_14970 [Oceanospirillales bacterium LUC14_002_19_P2]